MCWTKRLPSGAALRRRYAARSATLSFWHVYSLWAYIFRQRRQCLCARQIFLYLCHCLLCSNFVPLGVHDHYRPRVPESEPGASSIQLMLFLTAETVIQIALPDLHVTWLCVTLLSVLYFTYCNEMWNQLDALTGLLNQNSYLNRTAEMRRQRRAADSFLMWTISNR